jgi:phage shock protein A
MEYHRKGESIPASLKNNLANNAQNIDNVKNTVESLRNSYHKTESDYAEIIRRLNKLEQDEASRNQ